MVTAKMVWSIAMVPKVYPILEKFLKGPWAMAAKAPYQKWKAGPKVRPMAAKVAVLLKSYL